MAKARPKKRKKRMQELGYKALSTFVTPPVYAALHKCAQDDELSHSLYISALIEADLVKKGYLGRKMTSSLKKRAGKTGRKG